MPSPSPRSSSSPSSNPFRSERTVRGDLPRRVFDPRRRHSLSSPSVAFHVGVLRTRHTPRPLARSLLHSTHKMQPSSSPVGSLIHIDDAPGVLDSVAMNCVTARSRVSLVLLVSFVLMTAPVKIIECPRDAWQGLSVPIPAEVKADYLRALVTAGFRHLDAVSFV